MSKPALSATFIAVAIYLSFVFSNAGFDIRHWPEESRGACAFFMLVCAGLVGIMSYLHESDKKGFK